MNKKKSETKKHSLAIMMTKKILVPQFYTTCVYAYTHTRVRTYMLNCTTFLIIFITRIIIIMSGGGVIFIGN